MGIAFAASAYHYSPFPLPQVQNNLFYERAVSARTSTRNSVAISFKAFIDFIEV
jgi:hypothetical protein